MAIFAFVYGDKAEAAGAENHTEEHDDFFSVISQHLAWCETQGLFGQIEATKCSNGEIVLNLFAGDELPHVVVQEV